MDQKNISMELKQKNRTRIFRLFRETSAISRQEIVNALNLSLPTVTQNLEKLQTEGLIAQTGTVGNTGGRRARVYSMVHSARTAIGLDITRHHITAVSLDLGGNVIATLQKRRDFSRTDAYYRQMGELIREMISVAHLDKRNILGVGIGVPGLITPDNKTVFYGEILQFTGATCDEFSKYIPYPTALYNDANAAGFAELQELHSCQNIFYLMLSNNVGGAVYLNSQQYCGENIRSGEAGHMIIHPGGKKCYCGQEGCVDAYCSATVLSGLSEGSLSEFFRQLRKQDPQILAAWETYLDDLALTVGNLRMLFDCNIILGGYVGAYMDSYLDALKARLVGKNSFEQAADYLLPCHYKNEAIAAGAALNFIVAFLDSV